MSNSDYEEYHETRQELLQSERQPVICPIGEREDCQYFKYVYLFVPHYLYHSEPEWWCEHPDVDEEIGDEYCPLIVEDAMEEWE